MSLKDILDSMQDSKVIVKKDIIPLDQASRLEEKQKTQSLLPSYFKGWLNKIPKAERILDLGCGMGYTTMWLNENKGTTVGLDDDPILIQKAKQLHNFEYFYCDNYKKFNFKDGNFNVVFAYDALKNETNIPQTLSEIYRVLKIDGVFIFIMPLYSAGPAKEVGLYHWMPEMDAAKAAISKAGFKILESEQIDTLSFGMVVTQSSNKILYIKGIK